MRLIEAVERLNMSGAIGDGMVATLHDLAAMARLEQQPIAQPEPLPVPSVDDLVRLSPDTLEAIKRRQARAIPGGLVSAAIRVHEREGLEQQHGPQAVLVADGGRCRNCGCPR